MIFLLKHSYSKALLRVKFQNLIYSNVFCPLDDSLIFENVKPKSAKIGEYAYFEIKTLHEF